MNKNELRSPVRYGFLGGSIMLYFSMIGMVEVFSERFIIGTFINIGHIFLFGGAVGTAMMVISYAKRENKPLWPAIVVAGVVAPILPALLVLVSSVIDMRPVFINVTDNLRSILQFGLDFPLGFLVFFLVTFLIIVIMAAVSQMDQKIRGPLTYAVGYLLIIGSFSELVIQILVNLFGARAPRLFFTDKAINLIPAIVILVVIFTVHYLRERNKPEEEEEKVKKPARRPNQRTQFIQLALVVIALAVAPWILGKFLSQALFEVGRFILMGLGLNIVVGYAGLLDLGYVAFFAMGAYTMGVMTTGTDLNMGGGVVNFWMALPIAVVISVFAGILLGFPVLRMRGDYLAIVTLGFGEIIRILALSDWLAPIIGGAQGILKIPNPVFFGINMNSPQTMYYLMVLGALLVGFISIRLRDSRLGRQWMAMREDEDVAEAMGINLVQTKLMAFAIGAGFSGLAGAIFAARLGTIFPHTFSLLVSINALALIIVGGLGSIPGVVIGAIVLVGFPELLREFTEYRLLLYGILLIVMMLIRPEGFIPAEVFKRELHASEDQPEFSGSTAD